MNDDEHAKSEVVIERFAGGSARWRKYSVLLDGQHVGYIRHEERVQFPLPPGRHEVQVRLDFLWRASLPINIRSGETIVLETGDTAVGWRFFCFFIYLFRPSAYLSLARKTTAT